MQAAQAAAQVSNLAAQQQSVAAECQLAAAQEAFAAASPAIPVKEVEVSSPCAAQPESGSADHAEQAVELPQTVFADAVATGAAGPEVGEGTTGKLQQLQSSNAELRQQLAVALLQLSALTPRRSGSNCRPSGDACLSPPPCAPPAGAALLHFASPGGSAILGGSTRASGRGYMSDEGHDGYYTAGEVLLLPMSLRNACSYTHSARDIGCHSCAHAA